MNDKSMIYVSKQRIIATKNDIHTIGLDLNKNGESEKFQISIYKIMKDVDVDAKPPVNWQRQVEEDLKDWTSKTKDGVLYATAVEVFAYATPMLINGMWTPLNDYVEQANRSHIKDFNKIPNILTRFHKFETNKN